MINKATNYNEILKEFSDIVIGKAVDFLEKIPPTQNGEYLINFLEKQGLPLDVLNEYKDKFYSPEYQLCAFDWYYGKSNTGIIFVIIDGKATRIPNSNHTIAIIELSKKNSL